VDEIMRGLQNDPRQTPVERFSTLPVRMVLVSLVDFDA
jgi:hypothetical protein